MPNQKNKQNIITIIGFGRFGKLLAHILTPYGEINVISRKPVKKFKQISFKEMSRSNWIIPTVPISVTPNILKEISPYLQPKTLVMDVCSVKYYPCLWLKKYLPSHVELLGSHPMFGPDSAKHGLKNLQIVFCPIRINKKRYNEIKKIFLSLGLKIIETSPREHDRQSAKSLALVHFIGRALGQMKIKDPEISTLGFKKLLQVCENVENDSWRLFFDMHKFNPFTNKERKKFIKSLQKIDLMIDLDNYNLADLRKIINKIDEKIFFLIKERLEIAQKIGQLKKENNLAIIDKKREKELIERMINKFKTIDKKFIKSLYSLIFNQSYKKQGGKNG